MNEWIEAEIKLGLPDACAHRWVGDRLDGASVRLQTNHFFTDPARRLEQARVGVRVRESAGRSRLTVKGDADATGEALTRRIELEADLDAQAARQMRERGLRLGPWLIRWQADYHDAPEALRFLEGLADLAEDPLEPIGGFENERTTGRLPGLPALDGLDVELDRTRFSPDRTDYELEVEVPARGGAVDPARVEHDLRAWLRDEGGIEPFVPESKLARFLSLRTGAPHRR